MSKEDSPSKIRLTCIALGRHYKSHGKPYPLNDNNEGLFEGFCNENGLEEDDAVADDIATGYDESMFPDDLDENFPGSENKQGDEKRKYIFNIILKCWNNPTTVQFDNSLPDFTKDTFETVQEKDIEEIKQLYEDQCPTIYHQGMNNDQSLLQIMSVGRRHRFDYLQNLVDMYDRDRIRVLKENPQQTWQVSSWIEKGNSNHIRTLSKFSVPRTGKLTANDTKTIKASELAQSAVKSFSHRIASKLLFNPIMKIDDSLFRVLSYVDAALSFIANLTKQSNESQLQQNLTVPFAFDLAIAVGEPKNLKKNDQDEANDDDDDDDDDDDVPNPDDEKKGDYMDYIGDFETKLKKNNLKYVQHDQQDPENKIFIGRSFDKLLNKLSKMVEEKQENYPYRKRLISMVDRRTDQKKEEHQVYLFEPPKGKYTRDIPNDEAPEWYLSATRTCLIPSVNYNEAVAIGKGNEEKKQEDKKPENQNIGCGFHAKGGLLTFSFHVKAVDEIKCYLFWNGQMIRFFPDEASILLPQLFNMENYTNQEYIDGPDFKDLVENMKQKLIDTKFEAFTNM